MPRSAATDVDVPAFTAADVAVRADKGGRVVFVIPDPVARALRRAGKAGWVEVLGMGDGEGHRYPPGTRVHAAATVLLDVARELPNDVDIDAETRERTLQAAGFGALAAFVVGRAGWDDAARWWAVSSTRKSARSSLEGQLRRSEPADGEPSDHDRCRASG